MENAIKDLAAAIREHGDCVREGLESIADMIRELSTSIDDIPKPLRDVAAALDHCGTKGAFGMGGLEAVAFETKEGLSQVAVALDNMATSLKRA